MRYDIPWRKFDVEGEGKVMLTRRQAYPRFNQVAPQFDMPEAGEYLWDWYTEISQRIGRVVDWVCNPIPPSEWIAWQTLTGEIVYSWEHRILGAMDVAFCDEMNKELEDKRATYQREVEQKRGKGR